MVGGTHQQQPQQQAQLAPPSSSTTAPTTAPEEEEFLKRNTDCVYFLASPLTCKKGSECEYRHSDIARVNPRDCWYWLNGNCLNPKCAFRHPPLDGLLGAEVPTSMGPSVTPMLASAAAPLATPYGMPKQGVACIFFQKGFCLKGHLCPFLHGPPNVVSNKAVQSGPANPVAEPPKMALGGPEKSIQEQKFTHQANIQKTVQFLPPQGKQAPRTQAPHPARNGGSGAIEKKAPLPSTMIVEEPPRYKPANVVSPTVVNEVSASRPTRGVHQAHHVSDNDSILNGKDTDEYSREPSPGFDVLVNEVGDSVYYHNEEQFGRSSHDYDIGRSGEFDVDRDMYQEQQEYDHYNERDCLQGGQYAWEDHRVSSERILAGSAHLERKRYPRADSPDQFDESDLRHRISKQRRGNNGLRSVVSREHARESYVDRFPRRDNHLHRQDQGTLSSRLRGRIKIPVRSTSPTNENDLIVEREIDMGRQPWPRYSPGRPPYASSNQSKLRDKIKGRVSEDHQNERRDYRGLHGRRDMGSDNDAEFAGPKRLSELKSGKTGVSYEQQLNDRQALGKRKFPRGDSQQSEDDLSFEGPKPLSEILKRKRGGETTASDSHIPSSMNNEDNDCKEIKENEDNYQKERKEILSGSTVHSKEDNNLVSAELGGAEKQTGSIITEKDKSADGQSSLNRDASEVENEEGLIDEDAMLDQELEAYDHRDGDYDYEQIDGEDYNMDEAENPDEEYLEEDDGDDYAKKESVVYS